MKVGIAGSCSSVDRHVCVLEKINGISLSGRWSVNGEPDKAIELGTGRQEEPGHIIQNSDALIITDPGCFYFELANLALRNAKHVFLYSSLIPSISDAFHLVKLGSEANVVLKCGRTGNYGVSGLIRMISDLKQIHMIEFQHSVKLANSQPPELSAILLGDMEILSRLIHARNTSVRVKGISMFSVKPEVINARMEYDDGTSVNYYCNTVSTHDEHCLTLVLKEGMLRYDLRRNDLSGWQRNHTGTGSTSRLFENMTLEAGDCLYDDLSSFFAAIRSGPVSHSIYDHGFETIILTDRILEKVSKTLVRFI